MTVTAKTLFESASIPAAETPAYAAPAATRTIIDKMTLLNTTGAAIQIYVKIVPSGVAAANTHILLISQLASGASYTCPEITGHVLNTGDFISLLPGAVGVNCRISGREVN